MLIDGRTISKDDILNTDVCIVGAGAAGLTLAQEFEGAPFSVLLLESGSFCQDSSIQFLADGTTDGEPYPFMESRVRCFGGATTRWRGACISLDVGDFQQKPWLANSGWPFDWSHLSPYYQRARSIFGLSEQTPAISTTSPFHQLPLETKFVQLSQPLNLGHKYRQAIVQSHNITLVTHANVSRLIPALDESRVDRLIIQVPQKSPGHTFTVNPRTVILATGGIENARLLLASNTHFPEGLGNCHGLVGRFFMEHYYKVIGVLPLNRYRRDALFFTNLSPTGSTYTEGTLGLTDEFRYQHQLLNMHIRFYRYSLLEDTAAVIAAKQLQTVILHDRILSRAIPQLQQLWQTDWQVLPRYIGWHLWNRINRSARFDFVRLQAWIEQEPDPNNRVSLSSQRDRLGQPLAHLNLHFSHRTWESVEQSLLHIQQALYQQGLGKLQYDRDRLKHLTSYDKIGLHHMGTTRMHESPKYGVVDPNCKVHELANLYVAGSSIFPTGGAANPTLTIAALALRLADHIKKQYEVPLAA